MGSFRRAFLGYRRAEVDAAIAGREAQIGELEEQVASLSEMVLGRDREIGSLRDALRDANARHDRSLAALQTVTMRLEEIHAQARGQATRIRMQALQDAVEINRRVKQISDRIEITDAIETGDRIEIEPLPTNGTDPALAERGEARSAPELFEEMVEVEIGSLGDFSQLVGFEDAAEKIGATSEISVRKFSEGRATLSMRLDEPVELLRELEERSPMDFRVRRTSEDRVVLDLDDDEAAEAA